MTGQLGKMEFAHGENKYQNAIARRAALRTGK
jgi:hypothetical protein